MPVMKHVKACQIRPAISAAASENTPTLAADSKLCFCELMSLP